MAYEELVTVDGSASSWQVPCADGMGGFVWGTPPSSDIASSTTITIPVSSWGFNGTATVTILGVTADGIVMVSPSAESIDTVADYGVFCSEQGDGTLTFTAVSNPTSSITYNVVIISESGSPTPSFSGDDVIFIDYDGTELYKYSKSDIDSMSELPENPSHTGLVAQGWNWTLAEIKAQLTAMPDQPVIVGQNYTTASGDTEIDIILPEELKESIILTICVNGTITVDWGDNSAATTITGNSITTRVAPTHEYASGGLYTIVIHVVSGEFSFYGASNYLLIRNGTNSNRSKVYANVVKSIRIGSGITTINSSSFMYCTSLQAITIPKNITTIGDGVFRYCYKLKSVTIPNTITMIDTYTFSSCYCLYSVSIPSNTTAFGNYAFEYCEFLKLLTIPNSITTIGTNAFYHDNISSSITIPNTVTSIGSGLFGYGYILSSITLPNNITSIPSSIFYQCASLSSFTIPTMVTSIGSSAFYNCYTLSSITISNNVTSIGDNAFNGCLSLTSITIPSNVTSIGAKAFASCHGAQEYHLKSTTPPTLNNTTAFTDIPPYCIIYVPSGSLTAYQTATNWSEYASYMQEESA